MLSVLTPFVAYWPPEYLGGSGVLATVTAGLYISWNGLRLISAATRLQGIFFWDFLIYVIEGMVFLITGLQARTLIAGIRGYSLSDLALSAAVVSAVVIAARFVWMYPATYLPRWLFPAMRRKRSVAALAMAVRAGLHRRARHRLARGGAGDPVHDGDGESVSQRDLILFLTFCRHPGDARRPRPDAASGNARARSCPCRAARAPCRPGRGIRARRQAIEAAVARLDALAAERQLPDEIVRPLRAQQRDRLKHLENRDGDAAHKKLVESHDEIAFELITAERQLINELYRRGKLKDEGRRRIERELDLRDAHLTNLRAEE